MKKNLAFGLILSAILVACPTPPVATAKITVSPKTQTLQAGASAVAFSATLENSTATINWTLEPATGSGSLSATTGSSVNYTPPSTVANSLNVTVKATAGSISDSATVTINKPTALTSVSGTVQNWAATGNSVGTVKILAGFGNFISTDQIGVDGTINQAGLFDIALAVPTSNLLRVWNTPSDVCQTETPANVTITNPIQLTWGALSARFGSQQAGIFWGNNSNISNVTKQVILMYSTATTAVSGTCGSIGIFSLNLIAGWNYLIQESNAQTITYRTGTLPTDVNWYSVPPTSAGAMN